MLSSLSLWHHKSVNVETNVIYLPAERKLFRDQILLQPGYFNKWPHQVTSEERRLQRGLTKDLTGLNDKSPSMKTKIHVYTNCVDEISTVSDLSVSVSSVSGETTSKVTVGVVGVVVGVVAGVILTLAAVKFFKARKKCTKG